jgi:hypothetical protein
MLKEMADRGERHRGHGDQKSESSKATPKLEDLGISKTQSSDWQKLAQIPDFRTSARPHAETAYARPEDIDRAEKHTCVEIRKTRTDSSFS